MKNNLCLLVLENVFFVDNKNNIYSEGPFDNEFFEPYLKVYNKILLCARIKVIDNTQNYKKLSNTQIVACGLPYYNGLLKFIKKIPKLTYVLSKKIKPEIAIILRLPGLLGILSFLILSIKNCNYKCEFIGDSEFIFDNYTRFRLINNLLNKVFLVIHKVIAYYSTNCSYVNRNVLPYKYRSRNQKNCFVYSSIVLHPENIISCNTKKFKLNPLNLITCGSLANNHKGMDYLIEELLQLKNKNVEYKCKIIGDGSLKQSLEQKAKQLKLEGVTFLGKISKEDVINEMNKAEIFLLCSRTEGTPRVLIEAMSRGLICFGSRVGGIPNLLSEPYLFNLASNNELSDRVFMYLNKAQKDIIADSNTNISKATEFAFPLLRKKRILFYTN